MRWLLGGLLIFLAVVTASVAILVFFVPSTAIERHILTSVSRATGTEITTNGPPDLTLFPSISMKLRDVDMRRPGAAEAVLTAREVQAEVGWLPLLTRWTVDIESLAILEPMLNASSAASPDATLERAPSAQLRRASYPVPGVSIGTFTLKNGGVRGLDDNWRISDIDAEVTPSNQGPLTTAVEFFLNGRKVAGTVTLKEALNSLQSNKPLALLAELSSGSDRLRFEGTAAGGAASVVDGRLDVSTADVDALSRWLGQGARPEYVGKSAALDGPVRLADRGFSLAGARARLDRIEAEVTGSFSPYGDTFAARDLKIAGLDPAAIGIPADLGMGPLTVAIAVLKEREPVSADVAFALNGEDVAGRIALPAPETLTPGAPVDLRAELDIPGGTANFEGTVIPPVEAEAGAQQATPGWSAKGRAGLQTNSARRTAAWAGMELPGAEGTFAAAGLDADVSLSANSVEFSDATLSVDETKAEGGLAIDLAGDRPKLSGTLKLDKIDTARYSAGTGEIQVAQLEAAAPAPFELELEPLKPSLEAYLAQGTGGPSAQLESLSAATVSIWSNAALGAEALRDVPADIDLDLDVGDLRHGNVVLGRTNVGARVETGVMKLDIREARPLEGLIKGTVSVDAREPSPAFELDVALDKVAVEKVVRSAGQRDTLRGTMSARASLSGSGVSQNDVVASLKGKVSGEVRNGVIVGYDVRRIVRPFANRNYNPQSTTPFEIIKAEFAIADGLARSPSIQLDGPAIRIRADGTANLRTSAIDYRSQLSLVPPPSNFSLPLKILGTWKKIKAALDWARLATQWTGPSPFDGLESTRKAGVGDAELDKLLGELVAKGGGRSLPPDGAALMRELTGKNR